MFLSFGFMGFKVHFPFCFGETAEAFHLVLLEARLPIFV
jgi:hypothetical protein